MPASCANALRPTIALFACTLSPVSIVSSWLDSKSAAVRPAALFESSQLLTMLTGESVQANKAIVGRNAFAHEAGIHQDGVLKEPRTYEIMRPQDVGQPAARLVLGRHSGRHAVQCRCEAIG